MKRRLRTGAFWFVILTLDLVACGSARTAFAQGPAQPDKQSPKEKLLAAEEHEQIKQRDRIRQEAQQLRQEGKLDEAVERLEQVLAIEQEVFGESHAKSAGTWQHLARLQEERDDLEAAEEAWREVLRIQRALYGQGSWQLAKAHWALKDIEFLRTLDADQRHQRCEQQQTSLALDKEALRCYRQGRNAEATERLKNALVMLEGLYPESQYPQGHPRLASSLSWLGFLLESQREYSTARRYFERALAMYRRLYPEAHYPRGHPDLATSLGWLGSLL